MKANNVLGIIGNTPVVKLEKLFGKTHEVWIKLEKSNPGGSIKDRIALEMIEQAERSGILNKDSVLVEPTSGNTGIGLALVAAIKGYKLILVMPESMSIERRRIMQAYGATFELTPRELGMKGAIEKSKELLAGKCNRPFENHGSGDRGRLPGGVGLYHYRCRYRRTYYRDRYLAERKVSRN